MRVDRAGAHSWPRSEKNYLGGSTIHIVNGHSPRQVWTTIWLWRGTPPPLRLEPILFLKRSNILILPCGPALCLHASTGPELPYRACQRHGFFLVNSGPQIPERDAVAATAARLTGVKHLVKLSSMDVQHGLAIGAWHERGEAAVRASGVPFTFVQPTGFKSNLLAWAPAIKAEGVVR
jgi:hypothetical protein